MPKEYAKAYYNSYVEYVYNKISEKSYCKHTSFVAEILQTKNVFKKCVKLHYIKLLG